MEPWESFLIGVIGALIGFLVVFKFKFLKGFTLPDDFDHRVFFAGLFIAVLTGGVYTMLVIEPVSARQAFFSGLTAEGCILGFFRNPEEVE